MTQAHMVRMTGHKCYNILHNCCLSTNCLATQAGSLCARKLTHQHTEAHSRPQMRPAMHTRPLVDPKTHSLSTQLHVAHTNSRLQTSMSYRPAPMGAGAPFMWLKKVSLHCELYHVTYIIEQQAASTRHQATQCSKPGGQGHRCFLIRHVHTALECGGRQTDTAPQQPAVAPALESTTSRLLQSKLWVHAQHNTLRQHMPACMLLTSGTRHHLPKPHLPKQPCTCCRDADITYKKDRGSGNPRHGDTTSRFLQEAPYHSHLVHADIQTCFAAQRCPCCTAHPAVSGVGNTRTAMMSLQTHSSTYRTFGKQA